MGDKTHAHTLSCLLMLTTGVIARHYYQLVKENSALKAKVAKLEYRIVHLSRNLETALAAQTASQ